jgi:hypothetical protein
LKLAARLDIYSLALLSAMVLTAGTVLLAAAGHWLGHSHALMAAGRVNVTAFGFAVFAAAYHLSSGHVPGSPEALSPISFAGAHGALTLTLLATVGFFVFAGRQAPSRGR